MENEEKYCKADPSTELLSLSHQEANKVGVQVAPVRSTLAEEKISHALS